MGAIEEQVARGQQRMARGNVLPREGTIEPTADQRRNAHPIYDDSKPVGQMFTGHYGEQVKTYRDVLEAMGFRFGAIIDQKLIAAAFPAGWSVRADDANVFVTHLYDAAERERGVIFFKDTPYDYGAHINWLPRYEFRTWFAARGNLREQRNKIHGEMSVCMAVYDRMAQKNVYWSPSFPFHREYVAFGDAGYEAYRDFYLRSQAAHRQVWDYLESVFPEHEEPFAYWDDVPARVAETK